MKLGLSSTSTPASAATRARPRARNGTARRRSAGRWPTTIRTAPSRPASGSTASAITRSAVSGKQDDQLPDVVPALRGCRLRHRLPHRRVVQARRRHRAGRPGQVHGLQPVRVGVPLRRARARSSVGDDEEMHAVRRPHLRYDAAGRGAPARVRARVSDACAAFRRLRRSRIERVEADAERGGFGLLAELGTRRSIATCRRARCRRSRWPKFRRRSIDAPANLRLGARRARRLIARRAPCCGLTRAGAARNESPLADAGFVSAVEHREAGAFRHPVHRAVGCGPWRARADGARGARGACSGPAGGRPHDDGGGDRAGAGHRGTLRSTLHLANPRNAWRSLARWRSSWLSREALAALVLIPVAAGYVGAAFAGTAAPTPASPSPSCCSRGDALLHGDDLREPEAGPPVAHPPRAARVPAARSRVGRAADRVCNGDRGRDGCPRAWIVTAVA